jgi:hypothetical protein
MNSPAHNIKPLKEKGYLIKKMECRNNLVLSIKGLETKQS